ncbi:flavodoxin domain-containing protein [Candidatus Bathyarchaeota archaeon]|nr:flavodoxin domain-containing protein [Candidatus Bathyarchaeota archaeon]
MRKIVVLYDTQTSNTEKMAKAVVEGASKVKDVEVELLKVGTRFDICLINLADAIILGSPTHYGNVTSEMRELLQSLKELNESHKLKLSGKMGAAFGSYEWDGGWVVDKLEADMNALGIKIAAPAVSAYNSIGGMGAQINEKSLQQCRELGKSVAEKVAAKT